MCILDGSIRAWLVYPTEHTACFLLLRLSKTFAKKFSSLLQLQRLGSTKGLQCWPGQEWSENQKELDEVEDTIILAH